MEQAVQQTQTSGKGKKFLLVSFSLLATGTLGYFGWHWWQSRSKTDSKEMPENTPELDLTPQNKGSLSPAASPKRNDDFPLKKGSKGVRVKQVQDALISKLGNDSLGKAGADGDFGSKTEAALIKAGYPTSIDENTFNVIVQGDSGNLDADATARELYTTAMKKDFAGTIKSLQKLKSKEDYTSVSENFKSNYRINGVRQTLVNGLLNSFSDEKQKQAIRLQFIRMGLNYDGKKWSLSGLDGIPNGTEIITTEKTIAYTVKGNGKINIPANILLGKKEFTLNGWVYFYPYKSDTLFKVKKQHIKKFNKK